MQNTQFQDLLLKVGQGLTQFLSQETSQFNQQEELLLRQLRQYNPDGQASQEIEKLIYQYQRMLLYMYSQQALQHFLNNLNHILSAQYSFGNFNDDLKCYFASFRFLLTFITEIPFVRELITEFEKIFNIQYDNFIAKRVIKLMEFERLRAHYYSIVNQKSAINLNIYTQQTIWPKTKQDYTILKFSFKKEKTATPQPYYYQTNYPYPYQANPQTYACQPPPTHWPQQKVPQPPQGVNSIPFPPTATYAHQNSAPHAPAYAPLPTPVPSLNIPMNYPIPPPMTPPMTPPITYPAQNQYYNTEQNIHVTHCPMPPQVNFPLTQQQFPPSIDPQIIQTLITDSIYQQSQQINQENQSQTPYSCEKEEQKQVLIQQPIPNQLAPQQFDDAYQASLLSKELSRVDIQMEEEESQIEKLLLKQVKQNVQIYDSRKKQPILITAPRLQKQVSQITQTNHDILSLQILEDFVNGKMQKVDWAEKRKEMQKYFDF